MNNTVHERLSSILSDHQVYHSDFQMDHFITIRTGGNTLGQYQQAVRELYSRYKAIKSAYAQRALLIVDIEELGRPGTLSVLKSKYDKERNRIKLGQKCMELEDHDMNLKHVEREFKHFFAQAAALRQKLQKEDQEDITEGEKWVHSIKSQAATDLLTTGRLSAGVVTMVQTLPMDMREPLVRELRGPENHEKLIAWFLQADNQLPALEDQEYDIKELLGIGTDREHRLLGGKEPQNPPSALS